MKYAVVSDIHGNLAALKAVLEDAGRRGITRYLFAGDYTISGPCPDECISLIRNLPGCVAIRGNEEKYLENLIGQDPSGWTDGQMQITYWTYKNTRRENLDYLLSLPHTAGLECHGVQIRMAHSSVDFMGTYPFYTWNSVTVVERNKQPGTGPEKVLEEMARERERDPAFLEAVAGLEKGVYIFGHSHIQWSYQAKDRGVYLINPGSCGLPLDGIRGSLPYTVLEISRDGRVGIEEIRVPFDKDSYLRGFIQTAQFREARIWSRVIAREWFMAQEHIHFFLASVARYAESIGDERRPYAVDTWEKAFERWNRKQEKESWLCTD